MKDKIDLRINYRKKWAVLDSKKKIVTRFRIKASAKLFIVEHKRKFFGEKYTLKCLKEEDEQ